MVNKFLLLEGSVIYDTVVIVLILIRQRNFKCN